jgi:hypothetical protein
MCLRLGYTNGLRKYVVFAENLCGSLMYSQYSDNRLSPYFDVDIWGESFAQSSRIKSIQYILVKLLIILIGLVILIDG